MASKFNSANKAPNVFIEVIEDSFQFSSNIPLNDYTVIRPVKPAPSPPSPPPPPPPSEGVLLELEDGSLFEFAGGGHLMSSE